MSKARINILWQQKAICMLMAAMLLSCVAQAQLSLKRQKYDSIAAKCKGEHAVYTDIIHRMEIKEENNEMVAINRVQMEKLFVSEKSLNTYNDDNLHITPSFLYGGDPNYTQSLDATVYIPDGNDYKARKNTNANGKASAHYTGLAKGALTSTSYIYDDNDIHILPLFEFSKNIPVLNSVFELSAPKNVKMGFLVKGPDTSYIKREIIEKNGIVTYRFVATHVPAFKVYKDIPYELDYVTHVVPYIISFRLTGAKKDSLFSGSPEAHHKFEYAYVRGLNLENDSLLNAKTAELTRNGYSDRDKAARIYDWVQKNFHYQIWWYDVEKGGNVPHQADTVCKRMFGDCKDMSSIIMAMCRKAGLSAYFALIGSNRKPYMHDELQSEYNYDHMICAIKLDGEWVFLDGTTRVQPFGVNRRDLQGKEAYILLDETHHEIVKIPVEKASFTTVSTNTTMNLSYSDVSGNVSKNYTGYAAWDLGEDLNLLNRKDERDDYLRNDLAFGNDKFLIKNYDVNRSDNGRKDVNISANYTLGNYAVQVKKDYYVNMNVNKSLSDLRINDADRKATYYIPYTRNIKETVTLNVPKGYRVSYLPKAAKGSIDGVWNYSISYTTDKKANTVTLTKELSVNTIRINPSQFEAHNKLVDELKKQYKETVVLTGK